MGKEDNCEKKKEATNDKNKVFCPHLLFFNLLILIGLILIYSISSNTIRVTILAWVDGSLFTGILSLYNIIGDPFG